MTMPTRRQYQAGQVTTLTNSITDISTSFTIADATNWPDGSTGNFWVTIDPNTASEERILCSSRSTTTVTVAASGRGKDGTGAIGHANSAVVWPSWSAQDADEANAHVSATGSTGSLIVHGLAVGSNVVGTTDTQTLTNKTLSGGTVSAANVRLKGIDEKTANYTLVVGDAGKLLSVNSSSNLTITVPSGLFSAGDIIYVTRTGTGTVTIAASGTTLTSPDSKLKLRVRYSSGAVICTGSNTFRVAGDLSA